MSSDPARAPGARPVRGADAAAVHVRLLRLFASPAYRPPLLPDVAAEILRLAQQPAVEFEEVLAVLGRDPVLAARVLSLAQSACYAARSPILSLKQAMVRLGLQTVRDLVLQAALKLRVFSVPGYDGAMERLSRHSAATAHLTQALCRRTAIATDYAFVCGLLHDVGFAACLLALADDARAGAVPFEALGSLPLDLHEGASGLVARLWGLPPEIQRVVEAHHHLAIGGAAHPVNAALIVAEAIAADLDLGLAPAAPDGAPGLDGNPPEVVAAACDALGLDAAGLAAARVEAAAVVQGAGIAAPQAAAAPA